MKSSQICLAAVAAALIAPGFAIGFSPTITISGVPTDATINYVNPIPPPANVTATGGCSYDSVSSNGLALYYSFDANTGTNVTDLSTNNLTGAIKGTTGLITNGLPGGGLAMKFSGDGSSYVDAGTSAATRIIGAFTLAAWINPTSTFTDIRGIIAHGANVNANSQDFGLAWKNGSIFFTGVNVSTTTNAILTDTNAAPLGTWTHVACSVNAGGTGTVYINGSLYTNGPMSVPQAALPGARALYVGRWRSGYDFAGNLDEVRMYRRALSSNEVSALAGTMPAPTVTMIQTTNGTSPTVISRVWTAVDSCANVASATQHITMLPPPPLILVGVPADVIVTNGPVPPPANVTAAGGCDYVVAPTNDLALYYSFDANTGTNVTDLSSNNLTGAIKGTASLITNGLPGGGVGMKFSGDDSAYVDAGTSAATVILGPYTLAAWIHPTNTFSDIRGIITKGANVNANSQDYGMAWHNGRIFFSSVNVTTTTNAILTDTNAAPLGVWTHVACTVNGSGMGTVYINGTAYTNVPMTPPQADLPGARALYVGRWRSGYDFAGDLDEVRMYHRALNSNEVASLAGIAPTPVVTLTQTTNGTCPSVITRVWTVTDSYASAASATQTITIVDSSAPILVGVPSNQTLFCGQEVPPAPEVTALDNGNEFSPDAQVVVTGSCPGTITRTWTAVDACGNSTSAQQVITIRAFDTDGDGLPDEFETGTGIFVSPTNTGSNPDVADSDGDGFKDGDEVNHGSDPNDPNSKPRVVDIDFDGDLVSDIGLYYAQHRDWFVSMSTEGFTNFSFGGKPYQPVIADYDGDGRVDAAVVSPVLGQWAVRLSNGTISVSNFKRYSKGIPAVGDFDGDGKADRCIYDPNPGLWHFIATNGSEQVVQFGFGKTIPVVGDFDGDGRDDLAVFDTQSATWHIKCSTEGYKAVQFGYKGVIPFVGDYDGDQKDDIGVYDPKTGQWYHRLSTAGFRTYQFGGRKMYPIVGDFDGDGKYDTAVYHTSTFRWYILGSKSGYSSFVFGMPAATVLGITK